MGKAKLGSWWAAGAAISLLVTAGVAAQTMAPDTPAPAASTPAAAVSSRHDERGGADQRVLTELHRRNQEVIADARIAERRASRASVRDYAAKLLDARAADDAKIVGYARRLGMSVDSIQLGAGATADGALTRVDLVQSAPDRFDYDFAAKMVNSTQATLDQTEKGEALARAPGMAALLRDLAPSMMSQQAQAMAPVATIPTPRPQALQLPGQVPGVSRTDTGLDNPPATAP